MNILAISDTHCLHEEFKMEDFEDVDMIIHSGDFANARSPSMNSHEAHHFLKWYNELPIRYKVLCAGNHDTSIQAKLVNPRHYEKIEYLEHETKTIGGIKIFGSPYTKSFGVGWAFNVPEHRTDEYWKEIQEGTDIVITHGPPKTILDLSYNLDMQLEYCGDRSLLNHIKRVNPSYHIFGHIHNNDINNNKGIRILEDYKTKFINASCVTDGKFREGLTSRGIKFAI